MDQLLERCQRLRPGSDRPDAAGKASLCRLARQCRHLSEEIDEVDAEIGELVRRTAPNLLEIVGAVGLVIASRRLGRLLLS